MIMLPTLVNELQTIGASINKGSASIITQVTKVAITQSTDKACINWQTFDIGSTASVNIAAPSASSVLLNTVSV